MDITLALSESDLSLLKSTGWRMCNVEAVRLAWSRAGGEDTSS